MSLYSYIKRAIGLPDEPPPAPAMAQITIITTQEPVKSSSGTRSSQARD